VILVLFAVSFSGEFAHGTIRNLFLADPRRLRVMGGKLLALLAFVLMALMVAAVAGVGTAFVMAAIKGIPTHAWLTSAGARSLFGAFASSALAGMGWGIIGVFTGVLLRSTALALLVALVWVMPLESILLQTWAGAQRWLPGLLLEGVGAGTGGPAGWTRAVLLSLAYAAAFVGIAGVALVKRDVA
jgi:hypothetical protein